MEIEIKIKLEQEKWERSRLELKQWVQDLTELYNQLARTQLKLKEEFGDRLDMAHAAIEGGIVSCVVELMSIFGEFGQLMKRTFRNEKKDILLGFKKLTTF